MTPISRRQFICSCAAVLAASGTAHALWPFGGETPAGGAADIRGHVFRGDAGGAPWKWSREAYIYRRLSDDQVMCGVCPHQCILRPGDRSICRSRINHQGRLYSLVYGNPCAIHLDPIEKKPLYHFLPGTAAFSIATTGCNLRCLNCQNWEISQVRPDEVIHREMFPDEVVHRARISHAASVAYTYSEPVTFYEYTHDSAHAAREAGLHNVLISAGYINREPLLRLCRYLDAANINIKSFSDAIYRKLNGARLEPVLNTFRTLHAQGVHFEMTHLVVPGYVDNPDMVTAMCRWILRELGPDHPLHFIRFFPRYKLDRLPPTPVATLERFREIAMAEGIHYVYVGNVPGHPGNHTYCHVCGRLVLKREGYVITVFDIQDGHCRHCNAAIPGVWDAPGTVRSF